MGCAAEQAAVSLQLQPLTSAARPARHPPSAVIVCTLAAVSAMVTGVVVGVVGLAEPLPQSAGAAVVRLASWGCVLLGVAGGAAAGSGGVLCCARLLGLRLSTQKVAEMPVHAGALRHPGKLPHPHSSAPCSAGQRRWRHARAGGAGPLQAARGRLEGAACQVGGGGPRLAGCGGWALQDQARFCTGVQRQYPHTCSPHAPTPQLFPHALLFAPPPQRRRQAQVLGHAPRGAA